MKKPKGPREPWPTQGEQQPVKPRSPIGRGIDKITGVIRRHPIVTAATGLFLSIGAPQLSETVREAERDKLAEISRSIGGSIDETQVAFNIWQRDGKFFNDQIAEIIRKLEEKKEYDTLAEYYEDNNNSEEAKKYYRLEADKNYNAGWYEGAAGYYEKAGEKQLASDCYQRVAKKTLANGDYEYAAEAYQSAGNSAESQKAWMKYAEDLFQKGDWRRSDYRKQTVVQAYTHAGLTTAQIESKFAEQVKLEEQKDEAEIEILTKIEPNNLKTEDYIKIAQFYDRQDKKDLAQTYWLKAAEKYSAGQRTDTWEFKLKDLYYHAGLNERDINLRLAQIYEKGKAWEQAAFKYSEIDDKENSKRCWLEKAETLAPQKYAYDETARAYSNGGDKENANKYYLLAAGKKEKYGKSTKNYDELYQAAALYYSGGNHDKAKELFQLAAEGAYKEKDFSLAANAYAMLGNHEKSKECLTKLATQTILRGKQENGETIILSYRIAEAWRILERVGMDEKEIKKFLAEILEASDHYKEAARFHEDKEEKKQCLKNYAAQLEREGKYWYAADVYDQVEDPAAKILMYRNACLKSLENGDYEMAEIYYKEVTWSNEESTFILDKLISAAEKAGDFAKVARFYRDKGEDEKANEFYFKAAETAESNGYWRDNSYSYEQAAEYYSKCGKDEDAKRCSILALELDMARRGLMNDELAEYCKLTGKTEEEAKLIGIKAQAEYSAKDGWRYEQPWYFARKAEKLDDHKTALDLWQLEFERLIRDEAHNDRINHRLDGEDSTWNLSRRLNVFREISRAIRALQRASQANN